MEKEMSGLLLIVRSEPNRPEWHEEYVTWYAEHMHNLMAVEGVRSARRFESIDGPMRYMSMYEIQGPDVFASPAYRAVGRFGPLEDRVNYTRNVYREISIGRGVSG